MEGLPRPKYPSDEQRTRPYVRVHLTIRNHPTYAHVFADPLMRGMWLGMMVVARSAYAGETDDTVALSAGDVCWIAGSTELRYALPRLEKLCTAMRWRLTGVEPAQSQRRASSVLVTRQWKAEVRNFQRKQWPSSAKSRSKKKNKIQDEEEEFSTPEAGAARAQTFAGDYRDALRKTGQLRKEPTESSFAKWTRQAALLFGRDEIVEAEAREVCHWMFRAEDENAEFWRATARSVTKFRKHYDQIHAKWKLATNSREKKGGRDIKVAVRNAARRRGVGADGDHGEVVDIGTTSRVEAGGDEHES